MNLEIKESFCDVIEVIFFFQRWGWWGRYCWCLVRDLGPVWFIAVEFKKIGLRLWFDFWDTLEMVTWWRETSHPVLLSDVFYKTGQFRGTKCICFGFYRNNTCSLSLFLSFQSLKFNHFKLIIKTAGYYQLNQWDFLYGNKGCYIW